MVSAAEKIGYGLGDAASNIVFQTVMLFLAFYYTDVVGLAASTVGTMFLAVRIFDAVTDPLMGMFADRTETRWGKFRPFLLWLCLPFGAVSVLVFTSFDLGDPWRVVYAFVTYALLMTVYTGINIPYSALGGVLTADATERVSVQSYRFAMAWVGGLLVSTLMLPLASELGGDDRAAGYQRSMMVLSGLGVVMFLVCFASTRERVAPVRSDRVGFLENIGDLWGNDQFRILCIAQLALLIAVAARGTATLYFAQDVLMLDEDNAAVTWFITAGMVGNIIGGITSGLVSARVDKTRFVPYGQVIVAALSTLTYFVADRHFGVAIALHFAWGLTVATTIPMIWAMVTDSVDYGTAKTGRRLTGMVFATNLFFVKVGFAVGGAAVGWLIGALGYDGTLAAQSESATQGIRLSFAVLPAVGSLVTAIVLRSYRLDDARVAGLAKAAYGREAGG